MFLNFYLFFSNLLILSICNKLVLYLFLDHDRLKHLKNQIESKRRIIKKSLEEQKEYTDMLMEKQRIEHSVVELKVVLFLVAIIMALIIIKTEPLVLFGYKFGFIAILITMIILGIINEYILKWIGLDIYKKK